MRLILFDLDGTLLTSGGIGRRSTRSALESIFGTSGNLDEFYPGGRTQEAIFIDTLADAGIGMNQFLERREELYQIFLDNFQGILDQGEYQINALPGAIQLIEYLNSNENFVLGLVTGNHTEAARLKLLNAGLDPNVYLAGAYGEESANRSDLVPLAKDRAETITGKEFPEYYTIVVGDTTRDVLSAKSVNATSFALTTGTDERDLLQSVNPDSIFENLHQLLERFEFLEGRIGGIDGI
jgi:phosphoglycolate phosphatase